MNLRRERRPLRQQPRPERQQQCQERARTGSDCEVAGIHRPGATATRFSRGRDAAGRNRGHVQERGDGLRVEASGRFPPLGSLMEVT